MHLILAVCTEDKPQLYAALFHPDALLVLAVPFPEGTPPATLFRAWNTPGQPVLTMSRSGMFGGAVTRAGQIPEYTGVARVLCPALESAAQAGIGWAADTWGGKWVRLAKKVGVFSLGLAGVEPSGRAVLKEAN